MADLDNRTPTERRREQMARAGAFARALARAGLQGLRVVRPILRHAGQIALAIVIIFEEWGWRPLADLLARLARFAPVASLEAWIGQLTPYPALAVFALPAVLLFPLKLVALALIASGHVIAATLLFIAAKVVGTALLARIFQLTQPALMQLTWFARAYHTFMPWKEALVEQVRASRVWRVGRVIKSRIKKQAAQVWTAWKPRVLAASLDLRAKVDELLGRLRLMTRRGR